ncbi:protein of unknown function [Hyphomicrobium sp. 1Nfss2.1]
MLVRVDPERTGKSYAGDHYVSFAVIHRSVSSLEGDNDLSEHVATLKALQSGVEVNQL